MRVLITGSRGFVGRHMQNNLHAAGHETLDLITAAERPARNAHEYEGDICDANRMRSLVRDLRRAFLESADRQIDMLSRALDESSWHLALWRLKGLCGSFGVVHMIALIEEAQGCAPGDAKTLARIRAMLSVLGED